MWVSQKVGNKTLKKIFLQELKKRLVDCNAQDWHDKISTNERCENYRGFKQIQLEKLFVSQSEQIPRCHSSNTKLGGTLSPVNHSSSNTVTGK